MCGNRKAKESDISLTELRTQLNEQERLIKLIIANDVHVSPVAAVAATTTTSVPPVSGATINSRKNTETSPLKSQGNKLS